MFATTRNVPAQNLSSASRGTSALPRLKKLRKSSTSTILCSRGRNISSQLTGSFLKLSPDFPSSFLWYIWICLVYFYRSTTDLVWYCSKSYVFLVASWQHNKCICQCPCKTVSPPIGCFNLCFNSRNFKHVFVKNEAGCSQ